MLLLLAFVCFERGARKGHNNELFMSFRKKTSFFERFDLSLQTFQVVFLGRSGRRFRLWEDLQTQWEPFVLTTLGSASDFLAISCKHERAFFPLRSTKLLPWNLKWRWPCFVWNEMRDERKCHQMTASKRTTKDNLRLETLPWTLSFLEDDFLSCKWQWGRDRACLDEQGAIDLMWFGRSWSTSSVEQHLQSGSCGRKMWALIVEHLDEYEQKRWKWRRLRAQMGYMDEFASGNPGLLEILTQTPGLLFQTIDIGSPTTENRSKLVSFYTGTRKHIPKMISFKLVGGKNDGHWQHTVGEIFFDWCFYPDFHSLKLKRRHNQQKWWLESQRPFCCLKKIVCLFVSLGCCIGCRNINPL